MTTSNESVVVRTAAVEDANAITAVHVQAWRETYAGHFPADFLAGIDGILSADIWAATIADDEHDVLVAEIGGQIIAWAVASAGRDDDAPAARELEGIYAVREAHGTRAGQGLLDAILGGSSAYLWVIEGNPRAEAFYTKNGFVRDGATKADDFAGQTMHLVRMVRR